MNKKLFVLPLLAFMLTGCGSQGQTQPSGGDTPSGEVTPGGDTPSGGEETKDSISCASALAEAKKLADGATSEKEYSIKGIITTKFAVKESSQEAGTYQFNLADKDSDSEQLVVWWASCSKKPNQGDEVVIKGKLQNYVDKNGNHKYEIVEGTCTITKSSGTTPSEDPTQSEDTPTGTGGAAGAHASDSGNVPANVLKLELDFTSGTFGNMPTGSTQKTGTAKNNDKEYNFANASVHEASNYVTTGYLALYAGKAEKVASFSNKTAIPGKIVKVDVVMPKEKSSGSVSAKAPIIIDFGTSVLGATSLTGGKTGGSEKTISAYVASGFEANYFSISCVQGVSDKGKASWYNASVAKIIVSYVA